MPQEYVRDLVKEIRDLLKRLESVTATTAPGSATEATLSSVDSTLTSIDGTLSSVDASNTSMDTSLNNIELYSTYANWDLIPGNSKELTWATGTGGARVCTQIVYKTGVTIVLTQNFTYNATDEVITITAS